MKRTAAKFATCFVPAYGQGMWVSRWAIRCGAISFLVPLGFVLGCSPSPSCSSTDVTNAVSILARNKVVDDLFYSRDGSSVNLEYIRTHSSNNNSISCKAVINVTARTTENYRKNGVGEAAFADLKFEGEITYKVERTDKGEIYVTLQTLDGRRRL